MGLRVEMFADKSNPFRCYRWYCLSCFHFGLPSIRNKFQKAESSVCNRITKASSRFTLHRRECRYLRVLGIDIERTKKNRFSIVVEAATAYLHRRLSFCCFAKFLAIAGRGSERKVLEKVEGVINIDHTLEKL